MEKRSGWAGLQAAATVAVAVVLLAVARPARELSGEELVLWFVFGIAGGCASVGAIARSSALELKRAALQETEDLGMAYPRYVLARWAEKRASWATIAGGAALLALLGWRLWAVAAAALR